MDTVHRLNHRHPHPMERAPGRGFPWPLQGEDRRDPEPRSH